MACVTPYPVFSIATILSKFIHKVIKSTLSIITRIMSAAPTMTCI